MMSEPAQVGKEKGAQIAKEEAVISTHSADNIQQTYLHIPTLLRSRFRDPLRSRLTALPRPFP